MNTILSFETNFRAKADVLFSDEYLMVSIFSDDPEEYYIKYSDVRTFTAKSNDYYTTLEFYGNNFQKKTVKRTSTTGYVALRLMNDNGTTNICRIFEDRTPLQTLQTQFENKRLVFENKMANSPKIFGNIYISVPRAFDYDAVIDGVQSCSFFSLPYENGCRVLTLPQNTWDVKVVGGDRENRWSTNELSFDFINDELNQSAKLQSHLFSNHKFIKT